MTASTSLMTRAQQEIQRRIRRALDSGAYPSLRSVIVSVHDGRIVLSGCVCTFHEKQLATRCAQREAGNMEIHNMIDVPSPTPR